MKNLIKRDIFVFTIYKHKLNKLVKKNQIIEIKLCVFATFTDLTVLNQI